MCAICGCSPEHGHEHHHTHPHPHSHPHPHPHEARETKTIRLERRVLDRNDAIAARNRLWLAERRIVALNLVSSPGAGKTTLLERTIADLRDELPMSVIEGDQETSVDADRIVAAGARAVQINTGAGCHLDAEMVERGLRQVEPANGSLVMIENVGNLVCPALFDLGEKARVVISSVTEGEDKPLKYPHMFRSSAVLVLNKIDLLPHVRFDVEKFLAAAQLVNPKLRTFHLSATDGDGLQDWYAWLRSVATT